MIVANDKFVVQENELNGYKFQLVLVIKKLEKVQEIVFSFDQRVSMFYTKNTQGDFGTYRCISKNSIGQAEEVVELYGQFPDHLLFILWWGLDCGHGDDRGDPSSCRFCLISSQSFPISSSRDAQQDPNLLCVPKQQPGHRLRAGLRDPGPRTAAYKVAFQTGHGVEC